MKSMPCSMRVLFLSLAGIGRFADAVNIGGGALRTKAATKDIVPLSFKYTLRICNAYPFPSGVDTFMERGAVKLNSEPLVYKACTDFAPPIKDGDRVEFKIGSVDAGTFSIQNLPSNDAVLLLVIYRHDPHSSAVAFDSHVFSDTATAQVAVLDVYKGSRSSDLWVQSAPPVEPAGSAGFSANATQAEQLRFNSVVAIAPGSYELVLQGRENQTQAEKHAMSQFQAQSGQAYVIVRCGVEAENGPAYPEDLMVFPSPTGVAHSAGIRLHAFSSLAVVLLSSLLIGAATTSG